MMNNDFKSIKNRVTGKLQWSIGSQVSMMLRNYIENDGRNNTLGQVLAPVLCEVMKIWIKPRIRDHIWNQLNE